MKNWAAIKLMIVCIVLAVLLVACSQNDATPNDAGQDIDAEQITNGEEGTEDIDTEADEEPDPYPSIHGADEDLVSLFEAYEDYFDIGVAINNYQLTSKMDGEVILKHFNSLTAENHMKVDAMHPQEDLYRWDATDEMIEFAEANGLKVRGHTLIWHSQLPPWIFVDDDGNDVSREVLLDRMKTHIQTIVGRYKGRVDSWDVLNEIFEPSDRRADGLRNSKWLEIIGPEYIDYALIWAHEADPDAKLIINDYNTHEYGKRQKMYELVVDLLERDIPIHGVGHQMHINVMSPSIGSIEQSIKDFADIGVMNYITELDMSIYSGDSTKYTERPEGLIKLQGQRYKEVFDVFLKYSDHIESVTVWGLSDDKSWLRQHPVTRLNWPLLFDEARRTKPAYWTIIELANEQR